MDLKQKIFYNINEVDLAFSDVEVLARVLTLYENQDNETDYNDKLTLIHILFDKVLILQKEIKNFTKSLEEM